MAWFMRRYQESMEEQIREDPMSERARLYASATMARASASAVTAAL